MLGPAFKLINMTINLLPFGLVIWGFYQMLWGMHLASSTFTFSTFVKTRTFGCTTQAETFMLCKGNDDFSWNDNIQATDVGDALESFNGSNLFTVIVFSLLNVCWILLYLKNSGLFTRSWGTIGYHAANVKSMKSSSYKCWGYFIASLLALMTIVGLPLVVSYKNDESRNDPTSSQEEQDANADQQRKMLQTFFNGCFQSALGLYALLTPAPDTIEYGEKIMNLKVNSQPWTVSRNVMEKFQDAILATGGGASGYLINLTGCSNSDVEGILKDVTVIPFQLTCIQKMTNRIMCKKDQVAGGDNVDTPTTALSI